MCVLVWRCAQYWIEDIDRQIWPFWSYSQTEGSLFLFFAFDSRLMLSFCLSEAVPGGCCDAPDSTTYGDLFLHTKEIDWKHVSYFLICNNYAILIGLYLCKIGNIMMQFRYSAPSYSENEIFFKFFFNYIFPPLRQFNCETGIQIRLLRSNDWLLKVTPNEI